MMSWLWWNKRKLFIIPQKWEGGGGRLCPPTKKKKKKKGRWSPPDSAAYAIAHKEWK